MTRRNLFESLDPRVLLSAAELVGSRLEITGTAGDDVIIVHLNKRFINLLTVAYNGDQIAHYALSAVTQVSVDGGDGNDVIWIDSSLDPMSYATTLNGGAGDDVITGGGGVDLIDAGDGNDKVYGNGGNDVVNAGVGRDSVWGGIGNDNLTGAAGNDKLNGEAGNDVLVGDKGNDGMNGSDGDDVVYDSGGINTIDLGVGNDSVPKSYGAGVIYGGPGNDTVVAVGGALVYGEDGDDNLQSWWLDGGKGNDSLHGLMGNDEIHGGAGDDLIRGYDGADVLLGDDGNDAIFGGVGEDTLFGGAGDDNLYGTNGHTDKHKDLGVNDDGFGQGGVDWFETDYRWDETDRNGREDRPVGAQNVIVQDPSGGQYVGGTFISSGTLSSFDVSATGMLRVSNGTLSGGTFNLNTNSFLVGTNTVTVSPTIITQPIGPAGWLSSGAYDTVAKQFVPPPLAHKDRIKTGRAIVEIPKGWNLGGITVARDEIVWYQIWRDGATPPTAGSITAPATIGAGTLTITSPNAFHIGQSLVVTQNLNLTSNGVYTILTPGTYTWDGTTFVNGTPTTTPASNEKLYSVPTLDGSTAQVVESTPHLYDGVENGTYRYLAVKRGTILVSGNASTVIAPKWTPIDTSLLALPGGVDLRIAGQTRVFHMSGRYDSLPTGGPKVRGIGIDGGAIWLPTDGTEPYFSSGK